MVKVGDKLYQIKYDWGKKPNGTYYVFEVSHICPEHPFGGRGINCIGGKNGLVLFIPENTFIEINKYREKKLKRILNYEKIN